MTTHDILVRAKNARAEIGALSSEKKNEALLSMASSLEDAAAEILEANREDVERARGKISDVMIDRLTLTEKRISDMAQGVRALVELPDPVGRVLRENERPGGLMIKRVSVPMGVVGIIYESRPNVTSDAAALALKSGNVCVLRGGKEAYSSSAAIVKALREGLAAVGVNENAINLIEDTTGESANEMMRAVGLIDLLIPRGGAGLINSVVQNSTVPVIQTGVGNCHVYVDESADFEKAAKIVINAKTQRPGVCNACESLLVHEKIAEAFLPAVGKALQEKKVEIRGDEMTQKLVDGSVPATEEDWGTEYADYILSTRVVKDLDEAIEHIRKYSTGHSEAIVTENYTNAQRFLNEVDAAAVYVNASTRFTDGGQFGFGAEIGISTQKLHARGPMGLKELTTTKYIIYGDGQIRE